MMHKRNTCRGFTLVELLVVIGIIAILIAILLPALNGARKQANKIKCATALKDLGNAMLMYVQDNKGFLPAPNVAYRYNVGALSFDSSYPVDVPGQRVADVARWFNLLGKYVMKGQPEGAATTAEEMQQQFQKTVIWGCPSYTGFLVASAANSLKGDVNRNYPPYAMNRFPTFTQTYPDPGGTVQFPTPNAQHQFEGALLPANGTWYKLSKFTQPSDRALLADNRLLTLEARAPLSSDTIVGQPALQTQVLYSPGGARGASYDFYRHGTYPELANATTFKPTGGKVAFNILYADGHVVTATDRETGYKALRMRFPL